MNDHAPLTDGSLRISLVIIIILLVGFAVRLQKSVRSVTKENAALIEQLNRVQSDQARLGTKSSAANGESERGGGQ